MSDSSDLGFGVGDDTHELEPRRDSRFYRPPSDGHRPWEAKRVDVRDGVACPECFAEPGRLCIGWDDQPHNDGANHKARVLAFTRLRRQRARR
jgi:hypothetical protein